MSSEKLPFLADCLFELSPRARLARMRVRLPVADPMRQRQPKALVAARRMSAAKGDTRLDASRQLGLDLRRRVDVVVGHLEGEARRLNAVVVGKPALTPSRRAVVPPRPTGRAS